MTGVIFTEHWPLANVKNKIEFVALFVKFYSLTEGKKVVILC